MKKIIINTLSIVALTIGASQAKAQLASDSPSPALKPAAPVAAAARPAAELQTASATVAVSESKKSTVSTAIVPSQGGMQEPAASVKKATVAPAPPSQEEIKPAAKAVE